MDFMEADLSTARPCTWETILAISQDPGVGSGGFLVLVFTQVSCLCDLPFRFKQLDSATALRREIED